MQKRITIELPDDRNVRRMIGKLARVGGAGNPYRGRTESEIAYQLLAEAAEDSLRRLTETTEVATATVRATVETLGKLTKAQPIAPGSYTRDTLPRLGARAEALLDSIWESAGKDSDAPTKRTRRRTKSCKPRGRLQLTDHGGDSVIEYLAKR